MNLSPLKQRKKSDFKSQKEEYREKKEEKHKIEESRENRGVSLSQK